MAVEKLDVDHFISLSQSLPVFDVRSEGEYKHAHIPGAYSLPLFNDEERKIVGTIYKQQSRELAIKKGLAFFGPKMKNIIVDVEKILSKNYPDNKVVLIHCWRGGMRSGAVAWLLDVYGFKVYTLMGGYKSFRNWVLEKFKLPYEILNIGGFTGSGKTKILTSLEEMGEFVIDLEGLAGHRGSAFGRIGLPEQPSTEMFENKLAVELFTLNNKNPHRPIWFEDESMRIGSVNIPISLWTTMRKSRVFFIEIPFANRLNFLVETYGQLDKQEFHAAIERIQKKLGGLETKHAQLFLSQNNFHSCFYILLNYYDRLYLKSLNTRENLDVNLFKIESDEVSAEKNCKKLIEYYYAK